MQHDKRPILLLLDWDGTLTTTSTLSLIASIATLPAIHPSLHSLSAAYSADLKRHNDNYLPAKPDRTTFHEELTYLASLHAVEKTSVERIEASGIFQGVRTSDIDVAAAGCWEEGTIALRSGWTRLIEDVQRRGQSGKVATVSVAWSRRFIAHLLGEADKAAGGNGVAVDDIDIKANEIAEDGSGKLDRSLSDIEGKRGIWTAADKALVMDQLIDESAVRAGSGAGKPLVIFIGDSPTDLECLVKADVGVCIRDEVLTSEQEALKEMLERVGVDCVSITQYSGIEDNVLEERDGEDGMRKLWWAGVFDEVCESGVLNGKVAALWTG